MTQTELEATGGAEWTGATVRDQDGAKLGTLVEVLPGGGRGRWGVVLSMPGRQWVVPLDGVTDDRTGDLSVPTDRAGVRTAPLLEDAEDAGALHRHDTGREVLADARTLQHDRYGGARNGFLCRLVGALATAVLAVLAVFVGAQDDVLSGVQLHTLPVAFDQVALIGSRVIERP